MKNSRHLKAMHRKPNTLVGLLLLTASGLLPVTPVAAQSVDDCVAANGSNAITLCKSLLDNGSRNRGIYLKLGKVYWGLGNYAEALNFIDQGLKIYPQDRNLADLKSTLLTANEEERRNKEAEQKNLDRVKQGQLKLSCRSKDTRDALEACRDYLVLAGTSDPVIEQRINQLENLVGQRQPEPTPAPTPTPTPTPDNDDTVVASNNNGSDTTAAEQARKAEAERRARELRQKVEQDKARRLEVVSRAQSLLNQMGLNVGRPDGVPGQKTQSALSAFYAKLGLSHNPIIDERTVQLLENAERDRAEALNLYNASRASSRNENFEIALQELNSAQSLSPFLEVDPNYERQLNQKVRELNPPLAENDKAPETDVVEPQPTPTPAPAPAPSSEQQATLLADIQNLNRLISVEQQNMEQTLNSVRRNAYLLFR